MLRRLWLVVIALLAATFATAQTDKSAILGNLTEVAETCAIHRLPDPKSEVLYTSHPRDLLVTDTWDSKWVIVLMSNGERGFALTSHLTVLPYKVNRADRIKVVGPRSAVSRAKEFVGQPISHRMRAGGFLKEVCVGSKLPLSLQRQLEQGTEVKRLEHLQPGDRLYFWDDAADRVGFGALYIGMGYFIGPAPDCRTFRAVPLDGRWQKSLVAARRDPIAKAQ